MGVLDDATKDDADVRALESESMLPLAAPGGGPERRSDEGEDDDAVVRVQGAAQRHTDYDDTRATTTTTAVAAREDDGLERQMDDVVNASTAGPTDEDDEAREDVEAGERIGREPDAFDKYLQPKFWLKVNDVKVHVSQWTITLWLAVFIVYAITIVLLTKSLVMGLIFDILIIIPLFFFYFCGVYGTMIVHELAHIAVCRKYGGRVDEDKGIILWPFGALAFLHLDGLTLSQEFAVTLAGPLSHIPQLIFWRLVSLVPMDKETFFHQFSFLLYVWNLVLLVWHLFPCYPMDGSRVLACALLLTKRIRVETAAWVVAIVSYVFIVAYFVLSNPFSNWFSLTALFSWGFNLDWIFGIICTVATSHVVFLLRSGRIRDHPTFSRYEVVYDAYHAFDEVSRPEVFL